MYTNNIQKTEEKTTPQTSKIYRTNDLLKPLGPNGTVITVISGQAGREQNSPPAEQLMEVFDTVAPLGRFRVPFWRPLDFEWVPKSIFSHRIRRPFSVPEHLQGEGLPPPYPPPALGL